MRTGFKRYRLVSLLVALFAMFSPSNSALADELPAGDPLSLVAEGVRSYNGGDFSRSVLYYEAAIKAGALNGELLFNLGSSYYRLGRVGPALAGFKGASRFLPRDGDVAANLSYLRKQRRDALEPKLSLFDVAFGWLAWGNRMEFLAAASVVLTLAALTGVGARILGRSLPWGATALCWSLSLLALAGAGAKLWGVNEAAEAVVIIAEVAGLSGPAENNVQLFTLHEGAEVEVLEQRSGFTRVTLSDGRSGWIRSTSLVSVLTDRGPGSTRLLSENLL
jgi:tetratricopeptide (TPR) repeat protein